MTNAAGEGKHVLAIDLGSGGPKVALVSDRGELVDHVRKTTSTTLLPGGGAEQDPDEWWRAISQGARELTARDLVPVESIVAVSCTSQWSVTVAVDEEGRHLMPAIHWMDSRGAPYTRAVMDGLIKVSGYGLYKLLTWLRYTGGVPTYSGNDSLAHILYIKHARPDIYERTYKFLEPMDYINRRLTGRFTASGVTVYPYLLTDNRDVMHFEYANRLVRWAGLDRAKLPDLSPVASVIGPLRGEVARDWGLAESTQVVVGIGDSQAATLGSGAVRDYEPHFCLGTSSWLTCHVPFKKTDLRRYMATMPAAVPGRNMVMAEQGPAGKCLDVFIDQWLYPDAQEAPGFPLPVDGDRYARIQQLAASVPAGSDRLIFLPWLNGAGPPSGDSRARGGFLNQTLRTSRAHAVRAVMEGIAYNLNWLRREVEHFTGRRFDAFNFIGGGAQSDLWCQIHADVFDRPVRRVADPNQAIVRGAAFFALMVLGHMRLDDIAGTVRIAKTFEPDRRHRAIYDELFAEFLNCYKSNRRIFSRLNPDTTPAAPAAANSDVPAAD